MTATRPSAQSLRLAVALAHSAPPLAVEFGFRSGQSLRAGHRPNDERIMPVCQLRQLLIADMALGLHHWLDEVETLEITGESVTDLGGGLYGALSGRGEHRCFAGLLPSHRVVEVMCQCPPSLDSESMTSSIKCDEGLGVTCVVLEVGHPSLAGLLDDAARWAVQTCLVEELIMLAGSDR